MFKEAVLKAMRYYGILYNNEKRRIQRNSTDKNKTTELVDRCSYNKGRVDALEEVLKMIEMYIG